jgi:O-Antigen ligase
MALPSPAGPLGAPRTRHLAVLIPVSIGWSMLSTATSIVPAISFKAILSQSLDFYLVYYIFVKAVAQTKTVDRIVYAVFAALAVCGIFGYLESYHGWSVLSVLPEVATRFMSGQGLYIEEARGVRTRSTFPHPILFGAALALALPLGFYLLSRAVSAAERTFLWLSLALMFLNIYKTTSRGPWLACGISLTILFLLVRGGVRRALSMVAGLILLVLLVRPGVWDTIKNTYVATLDPESALGESYDYRYALIRVGVEALGRDLGRMMWGYGPESFYYIGLEAKYNGRMVRFESCDSAIVQAMVDTGYVGVVILAFLLAKPMLLSLREFRRLPVPANLLPLVFFINILAFGFMMTNVALYGWGQQSYLLWIVIALSLSYPVLVRGEAGLQRARSGGRSSA